MATLTPTATRASFAHRLHLALRSSPWSLTDTAACLKLPVSLIRQWRDGEQKPLFPDMIVALAQQLRVDPCWLATGRPSPIALADLANFKRARCRGALLSNGRADKAYWLIVMQPEPARRRGLCRYCCASAVAWADDAATICLDCVAIREGPP